MSWFLQAIVGVSPIVVAIMKFFGAKEDTMKRFLDYVSQMQKDPSQLPDPAGDEERAREDLKNQEKGGQS